MKRLGTTIYCACALAGALTLLSGSVLADAKADAEQRVKHIEERFKAADANHDGKLTLPEAEKSMPRIAKNFAKIDKEKKGYVTVEEVKSFAVGTP